MKKALITGSSGLVGSESVKFLCLRGWTVIGVDNNTRKYLFGKSASTEAISKEIEEKYSSFTHISKDIRDKSSVEKIFKTFGPFDLIIHAAAQPSHEWSTDHAIEDFDLNAKATIIMLETYRHYSPQAVFIQVSSSKVYGDSVNNLPLKKLESRFDLPTNHPNWEGVDETMRLDGNNHSLFGASKACGDILAHEYGTYFNLPITIFRPVCITGSAHKAVSTHGYLAYLVKAIAKNIEYVINGYEGKQVRDNIHAFDLVNAFYLVYQYRKRIIPGEAYNIGGGRKSNNSILEAIRQIETILGKKAITKYSDTNRRGDHKWCIFSSEKFKKRYPEWSITYGNDKIINELCRAYIKK